VNGAREGTVTAFDDARGLGEVTDDGGATFPFHCTQVADGSRTIAIGAHVTFEVVAGHLGRWEAVTLVAARR
jgi:CspA family cold shock protein